MRRLRVTSARNVRIRPWRAMANVRHARRRCALRDCPLALSTGRCERARRAPTLSSSIPKRDLSIIRRRHTCPRTQTN